MKRAGHLYDLICDPENLRFAFYKAQLRKSGKAAVIEFRKQLDENLAEILDALKTCDFRLGNYSFFPVFDPKERIVCAAAFRERVMHHAVVNVCEPYFESRQIFDSYACRKGKGLDACLRRAISFSAKYRFYLKMDVHKYFDSIPHDRLKMLLRRYFKDGLLLDFLDAVIDSYKKSPGSGIPIGNLTSQYFANAYLAVLDHYVKEVLKIGGYLRYMDDFVLFSDDKERLKMLRGEIVRLCAEKLGLELNESAMNSTTAGLRFLGYVLRGDGARLSLRAKRRFRIKLAEADQEQSQARAQALVAFTERADSRAWRRKTIFGSSDEGVSRVNRGGSWNNDARNCRPANRDWNEPGYRNNNLGFRVALAPSSGTRRMPFGEQSGEPVVPRGATKNNRPGRLVDGADARSNVGQGLLFEV